MRISIGAAGALGLLADPPTHALPINAWSRLRNARCHEQTLQKSPGWVDAYSSDPTVAPYALFPYRGLSQFYWVYMGLAKAKAMDGTTHHDITNAGGDYTGTAANKWTGGILGGILVVNNGVEAPQFWAGSTGTPFANLTNFPASTSCKVMRPFKNFLVAGYVNKSGTEYPYMVKWSDPADSGTLPSSWDETDTTKLAGEQNLRQGGGVVVDMKSLGDTNVVYKEGSMVAMRLIGGNLVFSFDTITQELGVFAVNAVRNFTGRDNRVRSFVLGTDDVIVHDGRSVQSVIDDQNRRELYNNIDGDNVANCFVATDEGRKEMWICYPEQGSTFCTQAFVWNWRDNTWGREDLPGFAAMEFGFFDPSLTAPTWATITENWNTTTRKWNEAFFNPAKRELIAADVVNTKLFEMNEGEQHDGTDITFVAERTGWSFVLDRMGRPAVNKSMRKLVTEVWPHFEGSGTVNVYVGGQDHAEDPIQWSKAYPFVVGTDRKINCREAWRLLAFRVEGNLSQPLRLVDLEMEVKPAGNYW